MKNFLSGDIRNFVPRFYATSKKGLLVFGSGGDLEITVDTGFNGWFSLPENILRELKIELLAYDVFMLANEEEVELPVYEGEVEIFDQKFPAWFVPGPPLAGMEFLSSVGSELVFLLKQKKVLLRA